MAGTLPGLPIDGLTLPLNFDSYLLYTLANANNAVLQNTFGTLDSESKAQADIVLPAGLPGSLVGQSHNHAYVVLDIGPPAFSPVVGFMSNAVALELVP